MSQHPWKGYLDCLARSTRLAVQTMDPVHRRSAHELELVHSLGRHARFHALALLGAHPGLRVTSGYRSPQRNAAVGGVRNSWHIAGRAADFVGPIGLLRAALSTAREQRITPNCTGPEEAFVEDVGGPNQHLHVAW